MNERRIRTLVVSLKDSKEELPLKDGEVVVGTATDGNIIVITIVYSPTAERKARRQ